jgi:uncharacterized protein YodC (DUF2158 family)
MEFEIGDVVELKSGSPQMTVTDAEDIETMVIYWNPQKQIFERTSFETGLLIKIEKAE